MRAEAKKRGAAVIIEQIKERENQRIREREQLEREQAQMLKNIEAQKEAERKAAQAKHERNARMR